MKINILRSKLLPLALGLAMVVGLPLAVAKPADAAWQCASNYLCFYEHANFDGAQYNYFVPAPGCYNLPAAWNDRVSSVKNYLSNEIVLYKDANCSFWSAQKSLWAGGSYANMMDFLFWNDAISSFRVN